MVSGGGGHLVADLARQGRRKIRALNIKQLGEWYQRFPDVETLANEHINY
jgi:GDP-D-mannose 3',5'-epimerase